MNIKSILGSLFSRVSPQAAQPSKTDLPAGTHHGVSAYKDAFESASNSRPNYFSGKLLNETSFTKEQEYSLNKKNEDSKDWTADAFDAKKSYTSVILQQGRVELDSDFNEDSASDDNDND
jgi:hypothetical protein